MLVSMFNLDHRLAELRPSEHELRLARDLRRAAAPATRPARSPGAPARTWLRGTRAGSRVSRPSAG